MKYELAKELQEAGFPRIERADKAPVDRQCGIVRKAGFGGLDVIHIPTLSELIEACVNLSDSGDFHLEHWEGEYRASTCWRQPGPGMSEWLEGTTPEEAVARLWLALNKKV